MISASTLNQGPCLRSLFDQYNRQYFQKQIIPSVGFSLKLFRGEKLFGYFSYCRESHTDWNITVSKRLCDHPRALRNTLVHEMIHMLAHQRYRETGDPYYLDLHPSPGKIFKGRGHGDFFLAVKKALNQRHPELGLSVVSRFGDKYYEPEKIDPVRLLIVHTDRQRQKGMVYRLHPAASNDWCQLRATARKVHRSDDIVLIQVAGADAEGFPSLRKDNGARINMKVRSLRNFKETVRYLKEASGTVYLGQFPSSSQTAAAPLILRRAS